MESGSKYGYHGVHRFLQNVKKIVALHKKKSSNIILPLNSFPLYRKINRRLKPEIE